MEGTVWLNQSSVNFMSHDYAVCSRVLTRASGAGILFFPVCYRVVLKQNRKRSIGILCISEFLIVTKVKVITRNRKGCPNETCKTVRSMKLLRSVEVQLSMPVLFPVALASLWLWVNGVIVDNSEMKTN